MIRFLLGILSPLMPALQSLLAALRDQLDRIEARQLDFDARLAKMEARDEAYAQGLGWQKAAREAGVHAAAAEPRPDGETLQQAARRVTHRDAKPEKPRAANVTGKGDKPPPSHV